MPLPAIGFPAQPRHDLMSRLISQIRGRADTARQEAVTGLLADPAAARGGKVEVGEGPGRPSIPLATSTAGEAAPKKATRRRTKKTRRAQRAAA